MEFIENRTLRKGVVEFRTQRNIHVSLLRVRRVAVRGINESKGHQRPKQDTLADFADENSSPKLAGFSWAFNKKSTLWKRLMWFTISLGIYAFCFYQIEARIELYIEDPSTSRVYFTTNKTFRFPVITICPNLDFRHIVTVLSEKLLYEPFLNGIAKGKFNASTARELDELLDKGNINVFDLWNATRLLNPKIHSARYQAFGLNNSNTIKISELYTPFGICQMVETIKDLEFDGSDISIEFKINTVLNKHIQVIMYAKDEYLLYKYLILHAATLTKGKHPFTFQAPTIPRYIYSIQAKQFFRRNSKNNPCSDSTFVSKCLIRCLGRRIYSEAISVKCRLPFMIEFSEFPMCNKIEEINNMMSAVIYATSTFGISSCMCPQTCRSISYKLDGSQQQNLPDFDPGSADSCSLMLVATVSTNRFLAIQEEQGYQWYSVCSDLGGALGLWLGICILEFVDTMILWLWKLPIRFESRNKKIQNSQRFPKRGYAMTKNRTEENNFTFMVAGFSNLSRNNSTLKSRIFWSFISISALCFSVYHCKIRIASYLSNPTDTKITYNLRRKAEFPALTICPDYTFDVMPAVNFRILQQFYANVTTTGDAMKLFESGVIKINELWNMSRNVFGKVTISFVSFTVSEPFAMPGQPVPTKPKISKGTIDVTDYFNIFEVYTVNGICITLTPKKNMENMSLAPKSIMHVLLDDIQYEQDYYRMILHDVGDNLLLPYLPKLRGYKLSMENKFVIIGFRVFHVTHPPPCQSSVEVSRCRLNCLEATMFSNLTKACRLPFMTISGEMRPCETENDLTVTMTRILNTMKALNFENCNCPTSCLEKIFVKGSQEDIRNAFYGPVTSNVRKIEVYLKASEQHIQTVHEETTDSVFALLSDVGGALGLLLGICGFTLIKDAGIIVAWTFYTLQRRCSQHKQIFDPGNRSIYSKQVHSFMPKEQKNINIHGFQSVIEKKSSSTIRAIWFMISLAATGLCIYQCVDRTLYFWSDPSTILTYAVNNDSIDLPMVTICPATLKGIANIPERITKIDSNVWNSQSKMVGAEIPTKGVKTVIAENINGICIVFLPSAPLACPGTSCSLTLKHEVLENIFQYSDINVIRSIEDFIMFPYDSLYDEKMGTKTASVILQITEIIRRNTRANPCRDGESTARCVVDCVEKAIYSKGSEPCSLPFMRKSPLIPECSMETQADEMYNATMTFLFANDFPIPNGCSCHRKCRDVLYRVVELQSLLIFAGPNLTVTVKIADNRIIVVKEIQTYPFFSLLCDLGGTLGLYFGFGVLQIIEKIISFVETVSLFKRR